jgi:hypothetical protein
MLLGSEAVQRLRGECGVGPFTHAWTSDGAGYAELPSLALCARETSAYQAGGDIHHGEYLFSTTTGSVEFHAKDEAMGSNLDLTGRSMQDAEYNLPRIHLLGTSVNKLLLGSSPPIRAAVQVRDGTVRALRAMV